METGGSKGARDARLSTDLQAHIGVRLKAFYDSVLSEPIPDRFAELLSRLDSAGDGAASKDGEFRAAPDGAGSDAPHSGGTDTEIRQ